MKEKLQYCIEIITITILFFSWNCSSEIDTKPGETAELKFNVDSSRLGPEISEVPHNLKYNPPAGWEKISYEMLNRLSKELNEQLSNENEITFSLLNMFTNKSTGSVLNCGTIKALHSDTSNVKQIEKLKELFTGKYPPGAVKVAEYIKDKIHFTQFLIQEDHLITFKLIADLKKNTLIEFDYLIPASEYINEIKAVESSIGSIKIIN